MDAAQRWWSGQQLYTDIVEINPPLILVENVLLTGGYLTKTAYLAGVCVVIGISALWIRMAGGNPFAAIAAMVLGGWTDFGQRDHLALIFLLPYLSTKEDNKAVGLWAFLGVGLKPYFAAIPLFFVVARCLLERSTKPIWQPQNWVLGICCVAYVAITALVWPQYFSEIIPTARFVYAAYGTAPATSYLLIAALIGLLLLTVALSQRTLIPLAAATLGAIAAFFIQGRYWSYQFIPSVGLTIYLVWLALPMERRAMQIPLAVILLAMIGVQLVAGPYALYYANPIPRGVKAVAFFSDNVAAAYPHVFDCQVVHTSRFPALWTIPGAWNALNDRASSSETRHQARHLLSREILSVREDIRNGRPEIIFSDRAFALSYFRYPFNYGSLVPNGYRQVGSIHGLDIWLRHDVPSGVLNRPSCS